MRDAYNFNWEVFKLLQDELVQLAPSHEQTAVVVIGEKGVDRNTVPTGTVVEWLKERGYDVGAFLVDLKEHPDFFKAVIINGGIVNVIHQRRAVGQ